MARPLFDSILQQVGGLAAAAISMSNSCCWPCPQLQDSLHALLLSLQLGSVTLSGPQCLPRITVQRRPRRASRLQSRAQAAELAGFSREHRQQVALNSSACRQLLMLSGPSCWSWVATSRQAQMP